MTANNSARKATLGSFDVGSMVNIHSGVSSMSVYCSAQNAIAWFPCPPVMSLGSAGGHGTNLRVTARQNVHFRTWNTRKDYTAHSVASCFRNLSATNIYCWIVEWYDWYSGSLLRWDFTAFSDSIFMSTKLGNLQQKWEAPTGQLWKIIKQYLRGDVDLQDVDVVERKHM